MVFGKTNKQLNQSKRSGIKYSSYSLLLMVLFFFIHALYSNTAKAQGITFYQQYLEDLARRQQLLDSTKTDVLSFMARPLSKQALGLFPKDSTLHTAWKRQKGFVHFLPVELVQQYVTQQPFQQLDGPLVQSSGYQMMASAGIGVQFAMVDIQLAPQYVQATNPNYPGIQQTKNYQAKHWGNSHIKLNLGPLSIGLSTAPMTWGPSIANPLLMSNNHAGFTHGIFQSNRPLHTWIGNFEWQYFAGFLDPMQKGYTALSEIRSAVGDNNDTRERRYMNGGMIVYHPKWIKGFSVGVGRVVQELESAYNYYHEWNLLFKNVARIDDKDYFLETAQDQYASAFLRWVLPASHAELYTEWGRNDAFFHLRDFVQQPEHSRGYTLGIRKLFNISADQKNYYQFISEYTRIQQPSTWPVRSAYSWYVHGSVYPGYTQNGQILGAPIGPGGNAGMIRISEFKGNTQRAIQLESTTHEADVYEDSGLAYVDPSRAKWVDYGLALMFEKQYKHFFIATKMAYKRGFNYQWSQPSNATGLGLKNPNDLDSFLMQLVLRYR